MPQQALSQQSATHPEQTALQQPRKHMPLCKHIRAAKQLSAILPSPAACIRHGSSHQPISQCMCSLLACLCCNADRLWHVGLQAAEQGSTGPITPTIITAGQAPSLPPLWCAGAIQHATTGQLGLTNGMHTVEHPHHDCVHILAAGQHHF